MLWNEVLGVLEEPAVREQFGLFDADLLLVQHWIQETRIRWGESAIHREELGVGNFSENSWQAGLEGRQSPCLYMRATWQRAPTHTTKVDESHRERERARERGPAGVAYQRRASPTLNNANFTLAPTAAPGASGKQL